jgi:hypothetical protein
MDEEGWVLTWLFPPWVLSLVISLLSLPFTMSLYGAIGRCGTWSLGLGPKTQVSFGGGENYPVSGTGSSKKIIISLEAWLTR